MSIEDNPNEGTINAVPYEQAMEMTKRWQELKNPHSDEYYPKSYTFRSEDFREIFREEGFVKYIRIYPGVHEDGSVTLLAVGADVTNTDVIQVESESSGIYDFATPCPSTCGNSPLNHDSPDVSDGE